MDNLSLKEIAVMAGATLLQDDPKVFVENINKDTRTIKKGDLYVGLRGEKFDGNQFAADALARGASAVLLDCPDVAKKLATEHPVLLADNSLNALTRLATAWRARLDLLVVGITGSNGKTSTKDFTAAVLKTRFETIKTAGNLNNHIGVPLSVLAASSKDQAAVWEVGMNHPGEIAPLAALIQPRCAIITNIGVAHIEYMKTRDAIALEKGMLAEAVPSTGTVILNNEDDKTDSIAARCQAKIMKVGLNGGDLYASDITSTAEGSTFTINYQGSKYPASITVPGNHMVRNALLALAAGIECGVPLESGIKGLSRAELTGGRLEKKSLRGILFLDDSYNANPDSMEAALQTLRDMPGAGRRIAVLGKMGELGDYAQEGYQRTGTAAGKLADILVTVGSETSGISCAARAAGLSRIHETSDTASAARMLSQLAKPGDIVLLKGSRSARMETIFQHLTN